MKKITALLMLPVLLALFYGFTSLNNNNDVFYKTLANCCNNNVCDGNPCQNTSTAYVSPGCPDGNEITVTCATCTDMLYQYYFGSGTICGHYGAGADSDNYCTMSDGRRYRGLVLGTFWLTDLLDNPDMVDEAYNINGVWYNPGSYEFEELVTHQLYAPKYANNTSGGYCEFVQWSDGYSSRSRSFVPNGSALPIPLYGYCE